MYPRSQLGEVRAGLLGAHQEAPEQQRIGIEIHSGLGRNGGSKPALPHHFDGLPVKVRRLPVGVAKVDYFFSELLFDPLLRSGHFIAKQTVVFQCWQNRVRFGVSSELDAFATQLPHLIPSKWPPFGGQFLRKLDGEPVEQRVAKVQP